MEESQQTHIQAQLFEFALDELVYKHRESFLPLWTLDSWVKFLIWLSLNCGLSGERESMELFVEALGSRLTNRMRRIFFERKVDSFVLQIMADPADSNVLVMPLNGSGSLSLERAEQLLDHVGLLEIVKTDRRCWKEFDAVIAIPWQ